MAKKLGKLKPTKSNEEDVPNLPQSIVINQLIESNGKCAPKTEKSLVNSNSTNIIIRETINPIISTAASVVTNNGTLSTTTIAATKTSMSNLSIKDKSIKENLCKEEIVEGYAFLTFLTYSDLEVSRIDNNFLINKIVR